MLPTTFSQAGLALVLADLLAGELAAATVHLFINDIDPGDAAVAANFTPATFTGSAALAIGTYGSPMIAADGSVQAVAPTLQFNWTAGPAEDVFGVYVLSASVGTPFLCYARFDVAKHMGGLLDTLAVAPVFALGPRGFGAFVQVA